MKAEQFEEAMNEIDDRYIQEAEAYQAAEARGAAASGRKPAADGTSEDRRRPETQIRRLSRIIGTAAACICCGVLGVLASGLFGGAKSAAPEAADQAYVAETTAAELSGMGLGYGYAVQYYDAASEDAAYPAEMKPETYGETKAPAEAGHTADAAEAAGSEAEPLIKDSIKIIYTADMTVQTTEYDQAADSLKALTESLGGYFERSSESKDGSGYRYAIYTIRIPAAHFDRFLEGFDGVGTVTERLIQAADVTDQYHDAEARLNTAKIKLARLQELLAKAENMEDIISLENAISETEWTIDCYSGTLLDYDRMVSYSTVNVDLNEVCKVTEPSAPIGFGDRLAQSFRDGMASFGDGLQNLMIWLAYNWLTLAVIAGVITAAVLVIRKRRRR